MEEEDGAPCPIVGIGASAGGLEALNAFVTNIDPVSGACYVVVQHMAPSQKSIMDQLLQTQTDIAVSQIEDREPVLPNHIYIVPPGQTLAIVDEHFVLTTRDDDKGFHRPIDMFLGSLAEERARDAYCVILSGTGSDGAEGLKAVKAAGGFALVQESTGARFPGMPDSAVATGLVDFILPAGQIPGRMAEIMKHRDALRRESARSELQAAITASLDTISARLSKVSGNDFSEYKPGTLVRRIERRMTVMRLRSVEQFVEALTNDEKQAELLAQEFLIGVTRFFRDPAAFEVLREKVVAPIVAKSQRNIRVWVPGCSTGEEAYSIAILFLEEIAKSKKRHILQVFGTDIDMPALVNARYGLFSPSAMEPVSKERRQKYFTVEAGQYRAAGHLRECCVFAPHNLVQDPPFSRLDLISCRNLMIYLSSDLQKQVIPRFHFSLKPDGKLFLGPSEGLAGEEALFGTVDKIHRIFGKNADAQTRYSTIKEPLPRPRLADRTLPEKQGAFPPPRTDYTHESIAEREFLLQHAPPFALITAPGEVVYLSRKMTRMVSPSAGTPSNMIDAYLLRELRVPVRSALREAVETGEPVTAEDVLIETDGKIVVYDVLVSPLSQDKGHFLLTLTEIRSVEKGNLQDAMDRRDDADRDVLEVENFNLRRQLAASLEEHENSGQELKSSNEELLSMNEELQSSNEELETSREELQSINEELETVNAELQENNRRLLRANSDLKNLLEATDVAVLFLDRNFCVRNYTPSTTAIFGVRERDIGRPISDLSWRIDYPDLYDDARQVDETLQSVEREVVITASGQTFLLRIKPYRTTDNKIDGYVLSFVDITNRKNYEETLKRNKEDMARQYAELENLYDTTPVGLALMSREYGWIRINETLAEINGLSVEAHAGKTVPELLPDVADDLIPTYDAVFDSGKPVLGIEIVGETPAAPGVNRSWIADFYPVTNAEEVFAVGVCVREVTEQKRLMETLADRNAQQEVLVAELQHRVKNTLASVSAVAKLLHRKGDSAEMYRDRLLDRLQAISRTHNLLTEQEWRQVEFRDILLAELTPYRSGDEANFRFEGPSILLNPPEALTLGMAIHELTTNSSKYGALSVDGGLIEVTSDIRQSDGTATAELVWQEVGGPKIAGPPSQNGFGSSLLKRIVPMDLDGEVTLEFAEDGLIATITFPRETKT